MLMKKRKIYFSGDEESAELFAWMFTAFARSPVRYTEDDQLRRAASILDARDEISAETEDGLGRGLKVGSAQDLLLTQAEYEQFKEVVRAFPWPAENAREALKVRELVDGAESIEVVD